MRTAIDAGQPSTREEPPRGRVPCHSRRELRDRLSRRDLWPAHAGEPYRRELVAIASNYQLVHALALFGVAWLPDRLDARMASLSGTAAAALTLGTIFFSGTLCRRGTG